MNCGFRTHSQSSQIPIDTPTPTLRAEGGVDSRAVPGLDGAVHAGDGGGVDVGQLPCFLLMLILRITQFTQMPSH